MVVKYLERYIETQVPSILVRRNLRELIEEEVTNGREPTIIFDISSAYYLFKTEGNLQPKILKNNIEDFAQKIISYGANLVVIGRGNIVNVHSWHKKKSFEYKNNKKAFESGQNIDFSSSIGSYCYLTSFTFFSSERYKFHNSIKNVHIEAAELAAAKNCLAVLGQDSNYIIYEGIRNYIPLRDFDIRTFDCNLYDREKILEHLGLRLFHLPLFATLCGNDIVPVEYLYQFHKKFLCKGGKFINLGNFVSKTTSDPYKHVKDMVKQINNPNIDENLLIKSLDMYIKFSDNLTSLNSKLDFASERKLLGDWCKTLYLIYTLKEFKYYFFTGIDEDMPSSEILLRPLRKKIYGIVLYGDEEPIVKEWCLSEIETDEIVNLVPTFCIGEKPECEHPGLIRLWDKSTPNLSFIKWNLFCSSISETLEYSTVRYFHPKILFPVVALHFLETQVPRYFGKKFFKNKLEMETFLVVALLVSSDNYDPLKVQKLDSDTNSSMRLKYLRYCFIDTTFTLNMLNEACGLVFPKKDCCLCNYYDEILLNYVYEKLKGGTKSVELLNENQYLEAALSTFTDIILNGF